jgi:hypothetical protein
MKLKDFYKEIVYKNDNFTGGWSTYYYGVFSKVINDNNYKIAAEVGIGYGTHAKQILKNTNLQHLYLIDPIRQYPNDGFSDDIMKQEPEIPGNNFNELCDLITSELSPWKDKYTLLRKPSLSVTYDEIPDETLDCVFVDGAHDYYNVSQDLEFWWKKVRVGGQLLGDDYWMSDVASAVHDFSNKHNINIEFLYRDGTDYKIFCMKK